MLKRARTSWWQVAQSREFLSTRDRPTFCCLLTLGLWMPWQSLHWTPALLCSENAKFIRLASLAWPLPVAWQVRQVSEAIALVGFAFIGSPRCAAVSRWQDWQSAWLARTLTLESSWQFLHTGTGAVADPGGAATAQPNHPLPRARNNDTPN